MGQAEKEAMQEERNAKFQTELELLVAKCGGSWDKSSEADRTRFADALSSWILTSDDSAS